MTDFSQSRLYRLSGHKPRLAGAVIFGLVIAACLPGTVSDTKRAIIAWDGIALVYLGLTLAALFYRNNVETLKTVAASEDQNRWIILTFMTIASFVSLIAIFTLLSQVKTLPPMVMRWHLVLGAITVLASWSMMHMIFAVHYAHEYYGDSNPDPDAYEALEGLMFPGSKDPVFSDFMYYAYVVGMTCQVSDVQVSSHSMRRLTLMHGFLAFFFNTVVLALSVNIAASLLG